MNILSINTVSNICEVAIYKNGKLFKNSFESSKGQSEILIDLINKTLKQAKLELKDLNLLSALTGPGSFTGIRIGLSYIKTLSLSLNIPVIGISLFDALITSFKPKFLLKKYNYKTVVLDSNKIDSFFIQVFNNEGKVITNPYEYSLSELDKLLKTTYSNSLVIGPSKNYKSIKRKVNKINYSELFSFIITKHDDRKKRFSKDIKSKDKKIFNKYCRDKLSAVYIRPHYAKVKSK